MNPLYSIPPPHAVTVTHGGLLNAPMTDWLTWMITGLAMLAGWFLVPGQLRESAIALFAPVRRFLRSLCCPWLWEGVFVQSFLAGAYRGDLWCNIGPPEDDPMPDEQDWISADDGLVVPCLT